jgi:hypothetical protein
MLRCNDRVSGRLGGAGRIFRVHELHGSPRATAAVAPQPFGKVICGKPSIRLVVAVPAMRPATGAGSKGPGNVRRPKVLIGLGREILRELEKDFTVDHLRELNDADLKRLSEQLWHWHDSALRELIKRGHVLPVKKERG